MLKKGNAFLSLAIGALMTTNLLSAPGNQTALKIKANIQATGSDDYGYTYIDSNEPNGPTYNWLDYSNNPNAISVKSLLTDDNSIGPYQLGFNFPYYWYEVSEFYIKSNGGISFTSNLPFNHPFSEFKTAAQPNNLVCGLCGDLDPGPGSPGDVWWWTNGTDSMVIAWEDIREFSSANPPPVTSHTFQIILAKTDSSITFQYGPQTGDFTQQGSLANVAGIETVVGAVTGQNLGITYFANNLPAANMYTDSLIVRFTPPDSTTFQITDVGPGWVNNPDNQAFFMALGDTVHPTLSARNFGTVNVTTAQTTLKMYKMPSFQIVYNQTEQIGNLNAQTATNWTFATAFNPTLATFVAPYAMEYEVKTNPTDQNGLNDKIYTQARVLNFAPQTPVKLQYDGIEQSFTSRAWNGDSSGFANEFELPADVYPILINSVEFESGNLGTLNGGPAWVRVHLMDAGPNQDQPGTVIWEELINVTAASTVYTSTLPTPYLLSGGKFAVSVLHLLNESFGIRIEQTNFAPSSRGWEYTGGFAPDRSRATDNLMIRATITPFANAIGDNNNIVSGYSLNQNYPNPFNPSTQITFQLPKTQIASLKVFNTLGQEVKTLVNGVVAGSVEQSVEWNGTDKNGKSVANGVYFYQLKSGDFSETKKMILLK
ncbi:T9SS type A sorting domain-containing protein [bacterium]|nr:T9SS type A sorting domain-containing protein [bacterium]